MERRAPQVGRRLASFAGGECPCGTFCRW
jgi:hypothetical protein